MGFQIGQYRFKGASSCITPVPSEPLSYKETVINGGEESKTLFKDVVVTPTNFLIENQDYYLGIKIPRDMNYGMTFNIKLIKGEQGAEVFQFLKRVIVEKGGTGNHVYNVVLYETRTVDFVEEKPGPDGEMETITHYKIAAMIPREYKEGEVNEKDALYYKEGKNRSLEYYLGNGDTTYTRTTKFNDVSISASWIEEGADTYGYFELIFRPVEADFSQILIEMVRTAEDYNIQRYNPEKDETEYGRRIPLERMSFELYELKNLVNEIGVDISLSKIGVWSHPELMMAVNGEEIKVGPSGYYELDALPVKSLGIVGRSAKDNFTIDYQYKTQEEE